MMRGVPRGTRRPDLDLSVLSPMLCEDRGVRRPPVASPIDASHDDNWHGGY
jgi:hypothetical protein